MVEHYGEVKGNALSGGVTYFAFLSFFPIMALAFAVVGQVSKVYPNAESDLLKAMDQVLPGLIGTGEGQLDLATISDNAPGIFSIGVLLALYSGLGWLSGMRQALVAVFEEPKKEQPNFVLGKLRDVLAMVTLGTVLILSVALSGVATKLARPILEFLGLGQGATPIVWAIGLTLGLAASTLLFFTFFKLLASPSTPLRALWSGAILGALGFEVLKQLSTYLLAGTKEQPAIQAFGIALILVVWINYFSRVVMFSACWAYTARIAREQRERDEWHGDSIVQGPQTDLQELAGVSPAVENTTGSSKGSFAAGAAAMLAVVAVVRRRTR